MFLFKRKTSADRIFREQRGEGRLDMMQGSYYMAADGTSAPPLDCWINNISYGGISIDVDIQNPPSRGERLTVLYKLGVSVRRDVVEVLYTDQAINNWRCGCRFTETDENRSRLIRKFLNSK